MTILNRLASNWSRTERERLNTNWSIIENYLSNLQGQINLLTGGVDVQELINQINEILNQGNVIIDDLETALQEASTVIANAQNATTDANNAAQEALNAINDMQAFINQFGNAETYDNGKLYKVNNLVEYDGSGFICIKDTQGNTPPTLPTKRNEWWQLFAQRGVDGNGAVSKVAGKSPDVDGNVPLTVQDIGAVNSSDFEKLFNLSPSVLKIPLAFNYRGWQGVTVYNNFIYVVTDRDENFGLENIISVYSLDGKLVSEKRNAYTGLDPQGKFMSFGDINEIDGLLYATTYNSNDGGIPLISRVVIFNPNTLEVLSTYNIGGNVAESVTKHDNTFWVAYHDIYKVRRFDLDFNLIQEYDLPKDVNSSYTGGGPQGSLWEGNYYYVNIHGHNSIADTPYTELRKYEFNGTTFTYLESIDPPTVGSGQGLSKYGDYYFWNDRPGNYIAISKSLTKANMYAEVMPILPQQTVEPALLNGFTRWDANRTPRITLHNGVVYLSGMMRAPTDFIADGNPTKIAFFIPEQLSDYLSKNFTVTTNKGAVRAALAGTMDTTNGRRVVLGDLENPISGITWIAFDGINYPLLS